MDKNKHTIHPSTACKTAPGVEEEKEKYRRDYQNISRNPMIDYKTAKDRLPHTTDWVGLTMVFILGVAVAIATSILLFEAVGGPAMLLEYVEKI